MARLSTRKKLFFAVLMTVTFVALAEGVCRLYFWVRSGTAVEDAVVDRFHPMRYDLVPGQSLPANGPIARINNVGLRGPDADTPKKRTRVLCLGDSATFGYAPDVTDDRTYPAQLAAQLERSHPGKFEVLNAGRPSFSTLDCLGYFSYKAASLEPDIVVLMMGWNDTHLACPLDRPPERKLLPAWVESSGLMKMASLILSKFVKPGPPSVSDLRTRLKALPKPTNHLSKAVFDGNERVLADLARLCKDHGAKPILVRLASPVRNSWTDVDSLNDDEIRVMTPHLIGGELSPAGWVGFVREANSRIDEVGERLAIPIVNASNLRDPAQFVDVCHPNAAGNRLLAEEVAKAIELIPR